MGNPDTWEPWRAHFQARVKEHLGKHSIRYRDLADMLGYGSPSMIAVNLSETGPSLEFCERLAEALPDEFGSAVGEYWAARSGNAEIDLTGLQNQAIGVGLGAIEDALGSAMQAVRDLRSVLDQQGRTPDDDTPRGGGE